MTFASIVIIVVKILIVIAFLLTMAAVSVWADRRQSGLIQDRIGPTRAVVFLPRWLVQGGMVAAAIAVAGIIVGVPMLIGPEPAQRASFNNFMFARMLIGIELAIGVLWFSLLVIGARARRNELASGFTNGFEQLVARPDPRTYFYAGVVLHLIAFPAVRLAPAAVYALGAKIAGPVAGVLIVASAAYFALFGLAPGKVGLRLGGLVHPVADAIKLIIKEDFRPKAADKVLFALAPMLSMFPVLVTFAVVPFGNTLCFVDTDPLHELNFGDFAAWGQLGRDGLCGANQIAVKLQIADLNVGLLYIFAIAGTGIIGAALAGWASDNKFALLGGLRATSQMVSYEVAMGLTVVGLLMIYGTAHLQKMVDWQGVYAWGIFVQPFAFFLFLTALVAETKRVPFDQPEGESEIVAGYFLEYSSMKFGLFFLGEYAEFAFSSVVLVTLFLGGYHLPFLQPTGIDVVFGATSVFKLDLPHWTVSIIHFVTFFAKVLFVTWLQVFIRWTLPRFRYDQVMHLGWKKLLPLALVNILVTAVIVLAIDGASARVQGALKFVADITQAIVAVGGLVGLVAAVSWMLEPPKHRRFLKSSSARFAAAVGGTRTERMGP